ncbi:MAG: ABC transporter ATP-binding protein [Methylocystaceae bacterium]|nr:ABC transporter ATP-binding protein [Methylocystaceae bacterium]
MIVFENVTKTYNEGAENAFNAILNLDLTINSREITVLRGPSGSGKTTLLTLIGGMARPTSGRIHVAEREVTSLPERFLTKMRQDTFGFVFQSFNLIKGLSVLDNVMLPLTPLGRPRNQIRKEAYALLERLHIQSKAHNLVETLSGGEAQRTAIARALINNPPVLIADEPTANLDTGLSYAFMDIIKELKDQGKTVVMTSHDPLVWKSEIVDQVISVRDGKIESNPT